MAQSPYRSETHSQGVRSPPGRGGHAEPHRGSEDVLRQVPADGRRRRGPQRERAAGSLRIGLPDQGLLRERHSGVREVRARTAQIRRRRMPAARHDLRRAAQGDPQAGRVRYRRGYRRPFGPRYQGTGRLYGRHAADDGQRHLRRQRHRARDRFPDAPLARRLLRPRQGQDPFVRQVPVRRPHHSLSRLLARLRVRRQGPGPCPDRPAAQASGHHAPVRARLQGDRGAAGPSARRAARTWRPKRCTECRSRSCSTISTTRFRTSATATAGRPISSPTGCRASS